MFVPDGSAGNRPREHDGDRAIIARHVPELNTSSYLLLHSSAGSGSPDWYSLRLANTMGAWRRPQQPLENQGTDCE